MRRVAPVLAAVSVALLLVAWAAFAIHVRHPHLTHLDRDYKQWCVEHGGRWETAPAIDCVQPLVPPKSWFDQEQARGVH